VWQHLTTHGILNQILTAFHRQHRLPDRFQQILAEVRVSTNSPATIKPWTSTIPPCSSP
jgi:hypothetical protein